MKVRGEEMKFNTRYAMGNGLEVILEYSHSFPVLLMVLVMVYNFGGISIDSKLITIVLFQTLMLQRGLLNISLAMKGYFRLVILFERIAEILNMEDDQI